MKTSDFFFLACILIIFMFQMQANTCNISDLEERITILEEQVK